MPIGLLLWASKALGFFKSIPLKVWLIIGAIIISLIVVWRIESSISNHIKYVHALEQRDKDLTDQNTRLNTRVNDLANLNAKNQATYDESLRQSNAARQIAEQERQTAEARATHYRSIRDAIKATPSTERHPVSPAVQSLVDSLWNNAGTPSGNPNSH